MSLAGGRSKAFIAELLPQSPVYVPLLPEEAQWAIGQLHPVAELPFSILADEGFDTETYVDIFDGGPTVDARVAMLKTVAASRTAALAAGGPMDAATGWQLVARTTRAGFRAVLAPAAAALVPLTLPPAQCAALQVQPGDRLRVAPLVGADHPEGSAA